MSSRRRRILETAGLVIALAVAAYCLELAIPKREYFFHRAGSLAGYQHRAERAGEDWFEYVHLVSSSGLEIDMRVYRPDYDGGPALPVLLLLGGFNTGKDAVELVGAAEGIAYAAIDYPYSGRHDLGTFWGSIAAIPGAQSAFLDAPAGLMLALQWLLDQPWADGGRIELAGISLGVPFAAPAGALEQRFSRVWLLHGGGNNAAWVSANVSRHIENDVLRTLATRLTLFAVYGNSFDTGHWIRQIAPRPLVIVLARNDDFVPQAAKEPMILAAASPDVELLWTDGRHIQPSRQRELEELVQLVKARVRDRE
jgi:dienelactone hydrolase